MKKLLLLPLLLVTCFCFGQDAKEIIGKPIKIENILVAENDFPDEMNWENAGKACRNLGIDWRLPTMLELNILYKNKKNVKFKFGQYWSSEESNKIWAVSMGFPIGTMMKFYKSLLNNVRAVKSL